ncbi:hypothetical protein [Castellaniella sp.]|uniref:hypothetical protein n=1 Tax=Castellaniella sp. TaxID=1955812 RepID=UPI002AFEBFD5|nr:hypothetical protein [Castellaniella sp.]
MNAELIIARANRDIRPVANEKLTNDMLTSLLKIPESVQAGFWVRDKEGGHVCIFGAQGFPDHVIEYVAGGQDDSITTLYRATDIFDSRTNLMKLRVDLIREIKAATMTVNDSFTLYDEGRERHVRLKEMGTAQLVDTVINLRRGTLKI